MGSILLNMAANMLGLGNASTPLGLRAMKDLETLNPRPGTATNAMCMLLAINTSSVQLIPVTAIAILAANHSANPTAIVGTSLMATICAATAAVLSAKLLSRLPIYRLPPLAAAAPSTGSKAAEPATANSAADKSPVKEAASLVPLQWWGSSSCRPSACSSSICFCAWRSQRCSDCRYPPKRPNKALFVHIVDAISKLSIPLMLSDLPALCDPARSEGL